MKRILFLVLFVPFVSIYGQQNELTLEDAVLKGWSDLGPESRLDLKLIPGTGNYSYISDSYQDLIVGSVKSKKGEKTVITVAELNELLEEDPNFQVRHLYGVKWTGPTTFVVKASQGTLACDYKKKAVKKMQRYPAGAAGKDFNTDASGVAFTFGNNIWYSTSDEPAQITNLDEGHVAGQAIARSEFGITKGTFWSPTGRALAFYQKDETDVADYPLLNINTTPGTLNSIKYPMAGQSSERASVGVYHLESERLVYLQSPDKGEFDYFTNLGWSPDDEYVTVAELNRDQNHMKFNIYDASNGAFIKTLFEEKNDRYVEPEHPAFFIDNTRFVWVSEREGHTRLYLYDVEKGLIRALTDQNWEITGIVGNIGNTLIVTGTGENPLDLHGFAVDLKKGGLKNITKTSGYHSLSLDEEKRILVDRYSSVTTPGVTRFITSSGSVIRTLITSENPLAEYKVAMPEMVSFKAADNKTTLHARVIKPSDFDPARKYPVLVYVYGGPHAQMVTNRWMGGAPLWMYYQAEKGYIVFTVDNRGSAHRGFEFESVIHRNLGDAEMDDQLRGVSWLKSQDYIDPERMAIHGWSYGGFMTTSMMLRHPEVFKAGVAGGPVTDWSYYEVMYGERYMDRPEENPEGYEKNRLMNHVENLKGDLLLIHGTADDVVVMQHNLSLVKAFIDAGVQVDFFPYPMHPHNVRGKDRVHLMQKVLDYVDESLGVE